MDPIFHLKKIKLYFDFFLIFYSEITLSSGLNLKNHLNHTDIIVEIISHEFKLVSSPRCLRLNVINTPEARGDLQGFMIDFTIPHRVSYSLKFNLSLEKF
ncbi:hypothetical protein BpHYR1_041275 [Brachionus plicatilis]|uniref:Uncharacterized protein n=1 Tax=Brachionus plicatilis TaxID=10195 RepID=A0A3M7PHA1_BRAPC|nr:hypothetical protein BpHYR1_041275 [Brachionus plicatilis]